MEHDRAENIITEYGEQGIRQQAKFAQESMEQFGENNVYDTLTDPFRRTRQERILYVEETVQRYRENENMNISHVFEEKFSIGQKSISGLCRLS